MKNCTKQEILKIILSVAKEYDEKLNDKYFRITYQNGKEKEEAIVGFPIIMNLTIEQQL